MSEKSHTSSSVDVPRVAGLFNEQLGLLRKRFDHIFMVLLLVEWVAAILIAIWVSPYGWAGKVQTIHFHVQAAVLLGGLITVFPILLIRFRSGWVVTRHVVAISQMLWSALFIHLSGGRIETHFHVFGSLAWLAFYLDWTVIVTATVVVALDHLIRGLFWPESVYGTVNAEWWRFLEHAGWVVFEDIILMFSIANNRRLIRQITRQQAELEEANHMKDLAVEMAKGQLAKPI